MKIVITILLLLSFASGRSQVISIQYDHLLINSVKLDSSSLIGDYIRALGPPSRVEQLANNIYVFDSLGICIYENYRDNNKIIELSCYFEKSREFDFSPAKKFRGEIFLADYHCRISRHLSYRSLKKNCEANGNTTMQVAFADADFNYGSFNLLPDYNFLLTTIKNFSIDFRLRENEYKR